MIEKRRACQKERSEPWWWFERLPKRDVSRGVISGVVMSPDFDVAEGFLIG